MAPLPAVKGLFRTRIRTRRRRHLGLHRILGCFLLGLLFAAGAQAQPEQGTADTAVSTDNQFEAVEVTAIDREPVDADGRRPLQVRGAFGRGVVFASPSDDFAVQLRGRAQLQGLARIPESNVDSTDTQFFVRRLRLLLGGHALGRRITFYLQLGFSDRDLEDDRPVPVRDAFITWHAAPAFNLRLGQMKVPFDRQRITSSSKLQLVERSDVVNELNLDRDSGVQVYGDLGQDVVRYYFGLFGGDGRNRVGPDSGLLYAARIRVTPFGTFDDERESDHARSRRLRVAVAGSLAFNYRSRRLRSTQGPFVAGGSADYRHLAADVMVKYAGWSMTAQYLARKLLSTHGNAAEQAALETVLRPAYGVFVQSGYMLTDTWEVAARAGRIEPRATAPDPEPQTELTVGLNWYRLDHDLKLQTSYTALLGDTENQHLVRTQFQLFF